jgi:NAD(P)-dependent dehydrogenase (short-subunit alcohol dehydrogenase family)
VDNGRLKDRVAIITGAARGIGKTTAFKMAWEEASVVLLDILSQEMAQVTDELKAIGAKALAMRIDTGNKSEVDKMLEQAVEHLGTVDILVNNAGIVCPAPLEVTEEDWDKVVKVNLKGTFFCTRAVAPIMKKNSTARLSTLPLVLSLANGIGQFMGQQWQVS